jgi:hypothetical protein
MPRIWVALEVDDPREEEGGEPYDYCRKHYPAALKAHRAHAGAKPHVTDVDDVVVGDDDHPDYGDGDADYECLHAGCGKKLTRRDNWWEE